MAGKPLVKALPPPRKFAPPLPSSWEEGQSGLGLRTKRSLTMNNVIPSKNKDPPFKIALGAPERLSWLIV